VQHQMNRSHHTLHLASLEEATASLIVRRRRRQSSDGGVIVALLFFKPVDMGLQTRILRRWSSVLAFFSFVRRQEALLTKTFQVAPWDKVVSRRCAYCCLLTNVYGHCHGKKHSGPSERASLVSSTRRSWVSYSEQLSLQPSDLVGEGHEGVAAVWLGQDFNCTSPNTM
jgi:hypothetical protein